MSDKRIYKVKTARATVAGTQEIILSTSTTHSLGYWSIDPQLTGSMSADISFGVGNTRDYFTAGTSIVAGAVASQSNFATFEPSICNYIKITVVTTGTGTCDLNLVTQ